MWALLFGSSLGAQLFSAAFDGRIDDVQHLLKEGADVNYTKDAATPLFVAAQNGHDAVVKTLLGANAAVNQANDTGATPLFTAAIQAHDVIVKMLLEANAAVNQAANDDDSPLCAASRRGHPTTVQILLDAGADVDKCVNASFVDWDIQLLGGSTSLFAAALIGHEEVCRVLLRANANVHASDSSGQTALTVAVRGGHESIVRLLLDAGASLDDRHQSLTAQVIAIENRHVMVAASQNDAERLVQAVASNLTDDKSTTSTSLTSMSTSREATAMAPPLNHSVSSSSSSSMSSSSSRAMSSSVPCSVCKTRYAISAERCSKCNEMLPDASAKLTLLLKRAKVANAKGFSVDVSIECGCEAIYAMTDATCTDPDCGDDLPDDAEKLRILARRLDMATGAM